jgi:hypothetical protein
MTSVGIGDSINARIDQSSRIADGTCMGGWPNVSGVHITDIPDCPIHVHGDLEIGNWYQVTISDIRPSHIVAEVDHRVDGRNGERVTESGSNSSPKVWWVDTTSSECFHSTRSCRMIQKREGKLLSVEADVRNDPLPDEISDMRRCNYCY